MKLVRSAVLLIAAVAVPLMPTAAHADRYTHADATGDVVSIAGSNAVPVAAPERTVGDVVSSTVIHKRRNVVLRLQYVDLSADSEVNAHYFVIRTSKMKREVTLVASGTFPGGRAIMTKPSGKKVTCHMAKKIDYAQNTATVIVPRSCLGKPKWVKVGMAGISLTGLESSDTEYVDDAQTTGTLGSSPKFGPRVFR